MRTQEARDGACSLRFAMPGSTASAGMAIRMTCVDRAIIKIHFRTRRGDETKCCAGAHRRRRQLCGHWLAGWKLPFKLRVDRLPAELESKLSVIGPGYSRVQVSGDVLLIDGSTRRIFDVVQNVDAMMM